MDTEYNLHERAHEHVVAIGSPALYSILYTVRQRIYICVSGNDNDNAYNFYFIIN